MGTIIGEKRIRNLKLQHTSATPETIEDYYQATAKASSQGWFIILALMIECSRNSIGIIEVIGLVAVFVWNCYLLIITSSKINCQTNSETEIIR